MAKSTKSLPATKLSDDHRPSNWETARFWQDEGKWFHPVDLNKPDKVPVHGKIPDWVYERRGLEAPAPEMPQSIEALLAEGYNTTDLGNAERLVKHYGSIIHYCEEFKGWLIWDGRCWERDYGVKISALAQLTTRQIYSEATDEPDMKQRKALADHGRASESDHRITAMVHLAQSQMGIPVRANDLDSDPWLFNVLNGTINLKTGELLPHDKGDLLATLVPTEYDPKAKCPMWLKFLEQVTDGDQERIDYLQKAVGYSLTGNNDEQIFFFLYGLGWNGKSTFINTIRKLTGDYGTRINNDMLTIKDKASTGPKEGLAGLRGKRFACGSEVEDNKKLATSLIKDLTGGETITCDRKYEHQFEYLPSAKLWLFGNHKLTITDTTPAMWRRVKLVPFNFVIPESERDKGLARKLEAEFPGILAWAVKGCLSWQEQGLIEPQAVIDAIAEYQSQQDILHDFLIERCLFKKSESMDQADLYKALKLWCEENDTYFISKPNFANRIREKGALPGRRHGNKATWQGIRLLTDEEGVNGVNRVNGNPRTSIQEDLCKKSQKTLTLVNPNNPSIPEYPTKPCGACGGGDYWLSKNNEWRCRKCHPGPVKEEGK